MAVQINYQKIVISVNPRLDHILVSFIEAPVELLGEIMKRPQYAGELYCDQNHRHHTLIFLALVEIMYFLTILKTRVKKPDSF